MPIRRTLMVISAQVSIGSYPNTDERTEGDYKVRLNVRGRDAASLDAALLALREQIPELLAEDPSMNGS